VTELLQQGSAEVLGAVRVAPAPLDVDTAPGPATGREVAPQVVIRLPVFLARPLAVARGVPHAGTWLGIGLAAVGFALLALAWGRVAGLTAVGLQLPWLVSAGFTGLGLIVCGLTVIAVVAKARDASERRAQLAELRETLSALTDALRRDSR